MYFLLKMVIFQPAMLVYQRVVTWSLHTNKARMRTPSQASSGKDFFFELFRVAPQKIWKACHPGGHFWEGLAHSPIVFVIYNIYVV